MAIGLGEAARHTDSTNSGEIRGAGEDIRKIHLQRIVHAFAEFERRHRGSRRNQYVHFLERLGKIPADQLADFLRAQIISVVVTGTQNVSAENDAPFHFRAETFVASTAIKIEHVSWIFRSISITNSI